MRFYSFLSGIIVSSVAITVFIQLAFWQGWVVTNHEASRQSMASLAFASIVYERNLYRGEVRDNGCYMFPNDARVRIQDLVNQYSLTSDDLVYSADSLLCYGWIIPADL